MARGGADRPKRPWLANEERGVGGQGKWTSEGAEAASRGDKGWPQWFSRRGRQRGSLFGGGGGIVDR